MTALGFEKECDWVQYKLRADQPVPEKMEAIAARLKERYKLVEGDIDSLKHDKALVRKFFQIYNESFAEAVYNFIPFTDEEIAEEAEQTIGLLDKRLCCFLLDEDKEIAAFGISFPSISKALQKAKGSMFPFGWIHLAKALYFKHADIVDLLLVAVLPEYQNKGVNAMLFADLIPVCQQMGFKFGETHPQLETNEKSQGQWAYLDAEIHKRRRCWQKPL